MNRGTGGAFVAISDEPSSLSFCVVSLYVSLIPLSAFSISSINVQPKMRQSLLVLHSSTMRNVPFSTKYPSSAFLAAPKSCWLVRVLSYVLE